MEEGFYCEFQTDGEIHAQSQKIKQKARIGSITQFNKGRDEI